MPSTAEDVLTAALGLPDDDRLQLVEALIASFEPPDRAPFDDSWHEVIRRRSAELRSGQVAAIPREDVKRRAREAERCLRSDSIPSRDSTGTVAILATTPQAMN